MMDSLGSRMKERYEVRTQYLLPRRTYSIIRVDGKAFHHYTRNLDRPYDKRFMQIMNEVAMEQNYFVWRQKDAERNSLYMLAQHYYSQAALVGANRERQHDLIHRVRRQLEQPSSEIPQGRNGDPYPSGMGGLRPAHVHARQRFPDQSYPNDLAG